MSDLQARIAQVSHNGAERRADLVEPSSDPIDRRIAGLFRGNLLNDSDVERVESKSGATRSVLSVQLIFGWSRSSRVQSGAFHPENSIHFGDFSKLDQKSREQLDGAIASEPQILAGAWRNQALTLLPRAGSTIVVREFGNSWHYHDRCTGCRASGEVQCSYCAFGKRTCAACSGARGGYHHDGVSKTYWLSCGGCGGSGEMLCGYCWGRARVECRDCDGHGYLTHIYQADITAAVAVETRFVGDDLDCVWTDIASLSPETLVQQSGISDMQYDLGTGRAVLWWEVRTRYLARVYNAGAWSFDVHVVGEDDLIPNMPAILDEVLGPFSQQIIEERDPIRVLKLVGQRSLTRSILEAFAGAESLDLTPVRQRFENAISEDLFSKLSEAVKQAYDRAGSASAKLTWLRGVAILNVALVVFMKLGAFALILRAAGKLPSNQLEGLSLFVAASAGLLAISLVARNRAMRSAGALLGGSVRRCPNLGWVPGASFAVTCATLGYLLVTSTNSQAASQATSRTVASSITPTALMSKAKP